MRTFNQKLSDIDPHTHKIASVKVPTDLEQDGVYIYIKALQPPHFPDGANTAKAYPVYTMVADALQQGEPFDTLVESTSGNTGTALAFIAAHLGKNTILYMSPSTPEEKRRLPHRFGAKVIVSESAMTDAERAGEKPGYLNLNQYANGKNPEGFYQIGHQLWKETDGGISVFAAGIGSGGTISGISKSLKEHGKQDPNKKIHVFGAICAPGDITPGLRDWEKLKQVSQPWREAVDLPYSGRPMAVSSYHAFQTSHQLVKNGLDFAGPSTGLVFYAIRQELLRRRAEGTLDKLRNANGNVVVGMVAPDSWRPYENLYKQVLNLAA